MKYATLTLLCCCAFLSACDNAGDTNTSSGTDMAESAAGDQAALTAGIADTATEELESAVESAKAAADELAASAKEQVDAATEAAQDLSAAVSEKSAEITAAVTTDADKGESVYKSSCFACHGTGAAGAPKLGDKAAWEPRIAQGIAVLSKHAIEGFKGASGYMPPKGGNTQLSDNDVSMAVEYMVSQAR